MSFAEATAVQQTDSHSYTAHLHPDWVIGSVPHGGFVTSLFLSAVRAHFSTTLSAQDQPHTLALHLSFLRRTHVGPVSFRVKDVKLGRQTSVVHVSLSQGSREEVVGYVTNSHLGRESGAGFATGWGLLDPPVAAADLSRFESGGDAHWAEKRAWPNQKFRKATARIRSWFPRAGQAEGRAVYDQWLSFRDPGARWTDQALGFLVDTFPQMLDRYLLKGLDLYAPALDEEKSQQEIDRILASKPLFWYPTLLLNLEVKKALPAEGVKYLFTRVQARTIKDGRYDLDVVVMDEGGDVVALSNHVCFAVDASRNTAARKTEPSEEGDKGKTKL